MVYFYRLIFRFLVGLMVSFPLFSYASFAPVGVKTYTISGGNASSSASSSCALWVAAATANDSGGYAHVMDSATETLCNSHQTGPGGWVGGWWSIGIGVSTVATCPSNSLNVGSVCTCNTGFAEDETHTSCVLIPPTCALPKLVEFFSNTCVVPPVCVLPKTLTDVNPGGFMCLVPGNNTGANTICDGLNFVGAPLTFNGPGSLTACFGGTTVRGSGSVSAGGFSELMPPFVCDGSPCSGSPTGSSAPIVCPSGEVAGKVNGLDVCIPSTSTLTPGASETGSDSGTGTTSPLGPGAPPSATGSTSSTTCSGGDCITTKTYTDSNGNVVGTKTTDQPVVDFCAQNPSSVQCKKAVDSTFSGPCDLPPACTGDAVMCAIAAADFQTQCDIHKALKPDDTAMARANAALDGSDGINTNAMKAAAHANGIAVGSFDVAGKGWSRSCPADPVIPIPWGSISSWTLPLSGICSPLQILANAAVGITLLASLVWVIGGRKT